MQMRGGARVGWSLLAGGEAGEKRIWSPPINVERKKDRGMVSGTRGRETVLRSISGKSKGDASENLRGGAVRCKGDQVSVAARTNTGGKKENETVQTVHD